MIKRVLPIAGVVALGLVAPIRAEQNEARLYRQGTPVVVVGKVTSPPRGAIDEKKMQVAVGEGKIDYTLHFRKADLINMNGKLIDEDGLDDGMWVRAEGRIMKDPRRIQASRVQIIGKDEGALKRSAFYHPNFGHGYVSASQVAGMRETLTSTGPGATLGAAPFVIVGKVKDDTGNFERSRRIQVQTAGNVWTLHVPKNSEIRDARGEKISVHEVSEGQWVRAYGWRMGDLRLRAERLENIGREEAFRASQFYRADFPMGYVDPVEGADAFSAFSLKGTVRSIHPDSGNILILDENGREHVVYLDASNVRRDGSPVGFGTLRQGDQVTVEGRVFRFR